MSLLTLDTLWAGRAGAVSSLFLFLELGWICALKQGLYGGCWWLTASIETYGPNMTLRNRPAYLQAKAGRKCCGLK